MDADGHLDVDMRDFLRILRRRKLVLVATLAVLVVIGVGLSLLQTPVYSAETTVLIPKDVSVDQNAGPQFSNLDLLNRDLMNEIAFAEGDRVRNAVRQRTGELPDVSITQVTDTDTLAFTVQSTNAERAAGGSSAYAQSYLEERRAARTSDYLQTAETLVDQIKSLRARRGSLLAGDPQIPGIQASLVSLEGSLSDLRASGQLSKAGGSIVRQASAPDSPISPKIARNGIVAALLGLILGVLLAFVRDRLDDSLTSRQQLDAASGDRAVLALLPRVGDWSRRDRPYIVSIERPQSAASDAYRTLRASLQILDQVDGGGLRTLALTSPRPAEGKTTTVANLGVALARAGQRVTIVDLDLRRPRIETFFGLDNSVGFVSVLVEEKELADALQEVEGQPGLSVLAAGPLLPNPSEILSLGRARSVLQELRETADFVLIDCPPVLPVPDSLAISQMVDGMILVAAAKRTSKRAFSRAIELLEQVNAPLLGCVLNEVREGGDDDYRSGYSYGQYYEATDVNGNAPRRRLRRRGTRSAEPERSTAARTSVGMIGPEAAERVMGDERDARTREEADEAWQTSVDGVGDDDDAVALGAAGSGGRGKSRRRMP